MTNIPLLIRPWAKTLGPAGALVGVSGVVIFDNTGGGITQKALDRAAGTILAWLFAVAVLSPWHLAGHTKISEAAWLKWAFYGCGILCGFYWGYVAHLVGTRDHMLLLGSGTTVSLYIFGMYHDDWMYGTHLCFAMNLLGVTIGTLVHACVLPISSRKQIREEMAMIFEHSATAIDLLMELFMGDLPKRKPMGHELSGDPGSASNLYLRLQRRASAALKRVQSSAAGMGHVMKPRDISDCRAEIENALEAVESLIHHQWKLLKPASKEILSRRPIFGAEDYKAVIGCTSCLYYQLMNFYRTLSAKGALTRESGRHMEEMISEITLASKEALLTFARAIGARKLNSTGAYDEWCPQVLDAREALFELMDYRQARQFLFMEAVDVTVLEKGTQGADFFLKWLDSTEPFRHLPQRAKQRHWERTFTDEDRITLIMKHLDCMIMTLEKTAVAIELWI